MDEHSQPHRAGAREQGPQGTQRISPEQVSRLLGVAGSATGSAGKARLIGMGDMAAGQAFALRAERVTIGRSPICDIHIDEPSLSSEHARLDRTGDGWRIVNLLSTNGVFVNGEKVFSRRLEDNDVIGMGRIRMRFEDPDSLRRHAAGSGWRRRAWRVALIPGAVLALAAAVWLRMT